MNEDARLSRAFFPHASSAASQHPPTGRAARASGSGCGSFQWDRHLLVWPVLPAAPPPMPDRTRTPPPSMLPQAHTYGRCRECSGLATKSQTGRCGWEITGASIHTPSSPPDPQREHPQRGGRDIALAKSRFHGAGNRIRKSRFRLFFFTPGFCALTERYRPPPSIGDGRTKAPELVGGALRSSRAGKPAAFADHKQIPSRVGVKTQ